MLKMKRKLMKDESKNTDQLYFPFKKIKDNEEFSHDWPKQTFLNSNFKEETGFDYANILILHIEKMLH